MSTSFSIEVELSFPGTGECAPCCGPRVTFACRSISGRTKICGWTAWDDGTYDPGDPAAWVGTGRKWVTRTLSGTLESASDACVSCFTGVNGDGGRQKTVFTGSNTPSCEDGDPGTYTGAYEVFQGGYGTPPDTCPAPTSMGTFPLDDIQPAPFQTAVTACDPALRASQFLEEFTLTTHTLTACGCYDQTANTNRANESSGSALAEIDNEVDLYAEMDLRREQVPPPSWSTEPWVVGTSCCAETEDNSESYADPASDDPIFLTASSVKADITLTGAPSTTYTVRLTFTNSVLSTSAPLADTTDDILVTTDSEGVAELEYAIAQPALDRRTCLTSAEIVP